MNAKVYRSPKGLIYSAIMLGFATLFCLVAVFNGRFALNAKNNAQVYGDNPIWGAPLGYHPFGLQTLPWLILEFAMPVVATILTLLAYRLFVTNSDRFRTAGWVAFGSAVISAVLCFLAAGWMLEAAAGGQTDSAIPDNPAAAWYVQTANGCAKTFALATVIQAAAAVIILVSVVRHRTATRSISGGPDRFNLPKEGLF